MVIWHFILWITGSSGNDWTNFWGGFFSDVPMFGVLWVLYKKHNCHAKGCLRVGIHQVDGTHYITCRKHHPKNTSPAPASAQEIANIAHDAEIAERYK